MSQVAGVANPWVKVDPITETLRCERCGKAEYLRDRYAEVVLDAVETFLKVHRNCRPDGQLFDQKRRDLE